jgi:hypothetical protein
MGRGQPRSAQALTALLQEAGFTDVRALRTRVPLQAGVLVARLGSGGPVTGVVPNGPPGAGAQ